jgi:DNA-binding response OmpR family regulator
MPSTHILLVEDNVTDAMLIREHLHDQRWHFEWTLAHASTLAQARKRVEERPPNAILLDLSLPDSRGIDTYGLMQRAAPGVPIVVFSGDSDEALALSTIRLGAQDYLPKHEFNSLLLTRTIRYAIERNKIQTELAEALSSVKALGGLLPICRECKKVREDDGYWKSVEAYVSEHGGSKVSNCICPECLARVNRQIGLLTVPAEEISK